MNRLGLVHGDLMRWRSYEIYFRIYNEFLKSYFDRFTWPFSGGDCCELDGT